MTMQTTETATTALTRVVTDLEVSDALTIREAFEGMFSQVDKWVAQAQTIQITSEDQKREMKLARESRLALRDIRVKAEHTRKKLKEDSTRRGKAIDGAYNILAALIVPIEEHLLEQEKFAERAEAARRDALRDARCEVLRALATSVGAVAALHPRVGEMSEEDWTDVRLDAERAKVAREEEAVREAQVRAEVERKAALRREEERQAAVKAEAERVDRERVTAEENARLRIEVEAREAAARAERERFEEDQRVAREKARIEAEARVAAEVVAQNAQNELAAERARVARVEQERKEAEERKRAANARAKSEAESAPDREKLLALAAAFRATEIPTMSTTRGKQIATGVTGRLLKLVKDLEEAARGMVPGAEAAE